MVAAAEHLSRPLALPALTISTALTVLLASALPVSTSQCMYVCTTLVGKSWHLSKQNTIISESIENISMYWCFLYVCMYCMYVKVYVCMYVWVCSAIVEGGGVGGPGG